MFNQVFKTLDKDKAKAEEAYKVKIKDLSNQILQLFIEENLNLAEITDTLQTVQNHIQRKQLGLKAQELLKSE